VYYNRGCGARSPSVILSVAKNLVLQHSNNPFS
jgi:hypothetical protein